MKKILSNPLLIILLLVVFAPVGIFVMYKWGTWDTNWKTGLAIVFSIIWIASIVMSISQEAQLAAQAMRECVLSLI